MELKKILHSSLLTNKLQVREEGANKIKNKAFSLVELMVVIAIIGILSAIAMPSYRDYMIKSKVANAFSIINGYKTMVENYYNTNGAFPPNPTSLGLSATGTVLNNSGDIIPGASGIYMALFPGGEFHLAVNYDINLGTSEKFCISFIASASNEMIKWDCGIHPQVIWSGDSTIKYMPSSCQKRNISPS